MSHDPWPSAPVTDRRPSVKVVWRSLAASLPWSSYWQPRFDFFCFQWWLRPTCKRNVTLDWMIIFVSSSRRPESNSPYYLRQGGYVFVVVCLLATLRRNFRTDLHEIFREGWQWANEQMIKFWWQSIELILQMAGLISRHALAEVCTVPVLLVL